MKVVFLDIDGVMNHKGYFRRSDIHALQEFCPQTVENLKHILKTCNAKIVLSSTWRKIFKTTRRLKKELFCHYGLDRYIVGLTPVFEERDRYFYSERGKEIRWYMNYHGIKESDMVILDDDDDMGDLMHRLVRTSFYEGGLTKEKADEVIRLLLGKGESAR